MTGDNGNGDSRILSLESAKRPLGKGGDYITRDQAAKMVADAIASEVPKVHEWYLNQLPTFTARMIQDALMSYGLITLLPGSTELGPAVTPVEATAVSENAAGDTAPSDSMPAPADVANEDSPEPAA